MPTSNVPLYALNRGEVSKLSLGRVDVDRMRLSMERQVNMAPRVVGPASLRAGLQHLGSVRQDKPARMLPFVFAADDTAVLELTEGVMRVWISGTDLVLRRLVTTVCPSFGSGSWTTAATGGGASVSLTPPGQANTALLLRGGTEENRATAYATITVPMADRQQEHALRIVVASGPVKFRIGTVAGLDDVIQTTFLGPGTHSIAFTPYVENVYPHFESASETTRTVSSITIEGAGVLEVPTIYTEADLPNIRFEQSADVIFIACKDVRPCKIERRSTTSWSFVAFLADDGPFGYDGDSSIQIKPSALKGDITLTSDRPLFTPGHVGALFRIFHTGQNVTATLNAADSYSDTIRVSGVSQVRVGTANVDVSDRWFTVSIDGTYSGKLTLQRSLESELAGFTDYKTYTTGYKTSTTIPETVKDGMNNVIAWYRIGFKPANYTSGTAEVALTYSGGGGYGVARVTGYIDSQTVTAEVLKPFLNTTYSNEWKQSEWSTEQGFPSAVALHEGRLWFSGADRIWGSVSDAYTSFDFDKEGDAGTINRSIGRGPISDVSWLLSLNRLILGTDTSAIGARSSSFDEPLTPTNFNLKDISTQGASRIPALKVDTRGLYVQQAGRRVYEITWDVALTDYKVRDMTRLNDDIGKHGFVAVAVQRQPDTHIHLARGDGQVAVLLYDVEDQVEAWWRVETDGAVEDVVVLPDILEDKVFYLVRREVNGITRRFWELFARSDEAVGEPLNMMADCFVWRDGPSSSTIAAPHLVGKTVVIWADGEDRGTAVVPGNGQVPLGGNYAKVCVGLPYAGEIISSKLAYAAAGGTALTHKKKIGSVGLILADTHPQGIRYGQLNTPLDAMPMVERGHEVSQTEIWSDYEEPMVMIAGEWRTDARLHIQCAAPRPCTVMGVIIGMDTSG